MSMKALWAPWRMEFLSDPKAQKPSGCVFCDLPKDKADRDRDNLIVHRGDSVFVILNKYPYNNGHAMVVPYLHTAELADLPVATMTEMMVLAQKTKKILQEVYKPEGYNLGMNLGAAGGAGIRDHLHLHIVPRWVGDTNFMPVIGETKTMPQHLMTCYDLLVEHY